MSQPASGTPGAFGYNDLGQIITGNNNTNYILAFILGALQQVGAALGVGGGGTVGVQRTLASSAVTTDGTVSAGAKSVSFVTSSDFSGTINGAAFLASASKNIAPISPADTIAAIPYTVSAGTIYIDVLT